MPKDNEIKLVLLRHQRALNGCHFQKIKETQQHFVLFQSTFSIIHFDRVGTRNRPNWNKNAKASNMAINFF